MFRFTRREPVKLVMQTPVAEPPVDRTVIDRAYVVTLLDALMAAAQRHGCRPLVDLIIDERNEIQPAASTSVPVIPGRTS